MLLTSLGDWLDWEQAEEGGSTKLTDRDTDTEAAHTMHMLTDMNTLYAH